MSTENDQLSQDAVFDVLSSARRRYILYYLRQQGGSADINELATQIAIWENDRPAEELTSQDEKRVYVSLYQTHIPKLEDQGIAEYDSETGMVSLTDRAYQIDRYLSPEDNDAFDWQVYYLVLAVLLGMFFALVALDVWVFGAIAVELAGGAIIAVFAVSAAAMLFVSRRARDRIPRELGIDNEDNPR